MWLLIKTLTYIQKWLNLLKKLKEIKNLFFFFIELEISHDKFSNKKDF